MSHWRRALASLVGEQSARNACTDRQHGAGAEEAARSRLSGEGAGEDFGEGLWDVRVVHDHGDQRHQNICDRHGRHDFFSDRADRLDAADDDNEDKDRDHEASNDFAALTSREAKRAFNRLADFAKTEQAGDGVGHAVGLDHVAGGDRSEQRADAEQDGEPAPVLPEAAADIAHRAAAIFAIGVHVAEADGERAFGEGESHADEGGDPHPENRAGSAQGNGGRNTCEVAGADLAGQRGRESGEGADLALAIFGLLEEAGKGGWQFQDRIEFQPNHEIEAHAEQDDHHWREGQHLFAEPCAAPDEVAHIGDVVERSHFGGHDRAVPSDSLTRTCLPGAGMQPRGGVIRAYFGTLLAYLRGLNAISTLPGGSPKRA